MKKGINRQIELAILRADKMGVKVLSLAALNKVIRRAMPWNSMGIFPLVFANFKQIQHFPVLSKILYLFCAE